MFVAAIGVILAASGAWLGKLTLREYSQQRIAERGEAEKQPEKDSAPAPTSSQKPEAETEVITQPAKKSKPLRQEPKTHPILPPKPEGSFHERIDSYAFSLGENGMTVGGVTTETLKKGMKPFVVSRLRCFPRLTMTRFITLYRFGMD